jgi:hypothetical protein
MGIEAEEQFFCFVKRSIGRIQRELTRMSNPVVVKIWLLTS